MVKEQKQINVGAQTHDRLLHISKVTNVPMARLVSEWIEELFSLAASCNHAYYKVESSILANEVRCVLIGYDRKIHFGTGSEQQMNQSMANMINTDMKKKACGCDT